MARKRKTVRMVVEVSCPRWLTAAQARKEVRSLINHQAFWGHQPPYDAPGREEEISEYNFRAARVGPVREA